MPNKIDNASNTVSNCTSDNKYMVNVRIFDFNFYNKKEDVDENSDEDSTDIYQNGLSDGLSDDSGDNNKTFNHNKFVIQMFGINELGETFGVYVNDFEPFFFIKIGESWNLNKKKEFLKHLEKVLGYYWSSQITNCTILKRKKLYGFDDHKEHKFLIIKFKNTIVMNKVKNLWYEEKKEWGRTNEASIGKGNSKRKEFVLKKHGYCDFQGERLHLYESQIPPILRFFHIKDVSPSGWISIPNKCKVKSNFKTTTCKYEFNISAKDIIPRNDIETAVPYKICSFDIEASSSHGDFPVPIKTYKKLADNIVDYFQKYDDRITRNLEVYKKHLDAIIKTAFQFEFAKGDGCGTETEIGINKRWLSNIDIVYPKKKPGKNLPNMIEKWFKWVNRAVNDEEIDYTKIFYNSIGGSVGGNNDNDSDDNDSINLQRGEEDTMISLFNETKNNNGIISVMLSNIKRDEKLFALIKSLSMCFPELEGDKVTFIGSTFIKYGEEIPYLNNCIALDTCDNISGAEIESYTTEKEVLLAWTKLIQREDPDIIIGYNIFGFDYEFMYRRGCECNCIEPFLKLSRNRHEVCGENKSGRNWSIEESKIVLASGEHELHYIKMNGRMQIDLYNLFRRDFNLESYKLDSVSSHFIGDNISNINYNVDTDGIEHSLIKSKNLKGLELGNYITIEEIGHSTDYYKNGAKFMVTSINYETSEFRIESREEPNNKKTLRWCLAKDDVTPADIFRLTNGDATDRAIVAKYCIQDCNLVHHLMKKIDILTGFIEMAKICSVPMNFLVMRGQGIKLTSFIAKKCREKGYLMPVLERKMNDGGYEGAIVLEPKCDLYMDADPIAVCDYSSLYPSSMISENLCHSSKVWTKEYDLEGNIIPNGIWGDRDAGNNFTYDNLPNYKYVNVTYDTFKYTRKTPNAAAVKVKSGTKTCRFAQFTDGTKAVMPSVLEELLSARKATKKLIKKAAAEGDDFMEKVYDARQLAYKLTANSLYGQCGAKTSTFYEKDVAASTTATGRKLLIYAKEIVEQVYGGGKVCDTKNHGQVKTDAEYVYGDTDSVFFKFNLTDMDGVRITGKKALEITIELAQEAGALATKYLKGPHDLEYEKTFMPLCLLSKKRYVGILYETDPNKGKRKEMGIVLKRRDNAPIVKDVYGGVIDILMKEQDVNKAVEFVKNYMKDISDGKIGIDKLIITKSLRSGYKNPMQIAHKVLADRIAERDPGNKPKPGDRIPFVYIINNDKKKKLQGDKIETPAFIKQNNIKIDYTFYITNQIMKPVQQVFALVLEKIPDFRINQQIFLKNIESHKRKNKDDPDKIVKKVEDLRNKEVSNIIFGDSIRRCNNKKSGNHDITDFFIMPV